MATMTSSMARTSLLVGDAWRCKATPGDNLAVADHPYGVQAVPFLGTARRHLICTRRGSSPLN